MRAAVGLARACTRSTPRETAQKAAQTAGGRTAAARQTTQQATQPASLTRAALCAALHHGFRTLCNGHADGHFGQCFHQTHVIFPLGLNHLGATMACFRPV